MESWVTDFRKSSLVYPMVQGIVLFFAFTFVFVNLMVDISYTFLNPQIRLGQKG